jgi:UDP-N-acetylmuramate: L-alanyl-gamma-D-glutamyl-meso-diaminopimelate ligase
VLERRVRYCSLPEAIRDFFLWGAAPVVLAGTHGKTTTTSLTGWILTAGGLDPTVLVGGVAANFGTHGSSYRVGAGRHFVIEGDEYDSAFFDKTAKFLKYLPDVAVVNNVEFDHADIYADLDAVRLAFRRLTRLVPRNGLLLLGADSPHALSLQAEAVSPVETFGLGAGATWRALDLSHRVLQLARILGLRRSGHAIHGRLSCATFEATQVLGSDRLVAAEQRRALEDVAQLADVARPCVATQQRQALG